MKGRRFTEDEIIGILKEREKGVSVVDLFCKHGVGDAIDFTWHASYGGKDISEHKRLNELAKARNQFDAWREH